MLKKIDMKYDGTYYYANLIKNVLDDPFPYAKALDAFYGNENHLYMINHFKKYTVFHEFIYFVLDDLIYKETVEFDCNNILKEFQKNGITNIKHFKLPIEIRLKNRKFKHESFIEWLNKNYIELEENYEDYILEYCNTLDISEFIDLLTEEVFYICFTNRQSLREFNLIIAGLISETKLESIEEVDEESILNLFKKDGVLKRQHIPKWAKKAIYFRDRGRCVYCNKDLSGILSFENNENYDHIVPLAQGGLNDVTNLQLLCESCNNEKRHYSNETNNILERWF